MRPQAALKGGFYPAPPEAVAAAIGLLTPPKQPTAIIDPCCGQGRAIRQIAEALPTARAYAVELEEGRAKEAQAWLLPAGGQVLGPADFSGCTITPAGSFGLAWVNPPFDDEVGGGSRVEYAFLQRATQLLRPGGVMMFVCPDKVARSKDVVGHFFSWYQGIASVPFPADHRKYNEVVVLGVKRDRAVEAALGMATQQVSHAVEAGRYKVPPAPGPRQFLKTRHTMKEMMRALAASPLQALFRAPSPTPLARPPLELSKGQMALVLAGGYLDGVLRLPGEDPILVKATPFKEDYMKDSATEVRNEGTEREEEVQVTVMSQRIKLKIRVAEQSGLIHEVH